MENVQNYQQNQGQYQSIKPKIYTKLLLVHSLLIAIPVGIFLGMFFGMPLVFVFSLFLGPKGLLLIPVIGIIFYCLLVPLIFILRKKSLERTEYKFYSNKIEYYEGFLAKNRKTINYDRISNIGQTKGIIEGMFGLGSIYIDTASYSQKGHELSISYLENSDQVYDWISNITSKKQ